MKCTSRLTRMMQVHQSASFMQMRFVQTSTTTSSPSSNFIPSLIKPNTPFVTENAALEKLVKERLSQPRTLSKQELYIRKKLNKLEIIKAKRSHERCWDQVSRLLDDMRIEGVTITENVYVQAINALVRAKRVDKAHALIDRMRAENVNISASLLVYMINACKFSVEPGKAQTYMNEFLGRVEKAESDEEKSKNNSFLQSAFTNLINVYARAADMQGVEKTFNLMRESGVSPDTVTYGAVLKVYGKLRKLDKAQEIVAEMKQNQVSVDSVVYSLLIKSCAPEHKETAKQYFDQMETENIPRDQITYGTIMAQLMNADDYEGVYEYYERMKKANLRPTPFVYQTLLKTCFKDGLNKPIRDQDKYLEDAAEIGATFVLPKSDFDMPRIRRYWTEMTRKYQWKPSDECVAALDQIVTTRKEHKKLFKEEYRTKLSVIEQEKKAKLQATRNILKERLLQRK